ncbi:Profilin [Coemansia nantahalensis]|uniref:Profilin n=1 Tax=Coemansia nantahalensis TaxID=2789366 RepID=A0ACC1JMG1_9FUNG|nr:Profilin [Coemansia nantahalensis]
MSWPVYIEELLKTKGTVSAAIASSDTKALSVWAKSDNFSNDDALVLDALKGFASEKLLETGIRLTKDVKYMTLNADKDRAHGRKGADGVMIFNAGKAVIIVTYGGDGIANEINPHIEKFAEHLKKTL